MAIASERAPTMARVNQTICAALGTVVEREERAHVGERQREHRVLELHERREAPRVDDRALHHVWRCAVSSPAISFTAWPSAGRSTAKPSRQPPGEPGRFTTSVRAANAGDPARQHAVRRLRDGVGTDCLRDAERPAVEDGAGRLRRDVARPDAGAPVVSTTWAVVRQLRDRIRDLVALVRNDAPGDVVTLRLAATRRGRRRSDPRGCPRRRRPTP